LSWWAVRHGVTDALPESAVRNALCLPDEGKIGRESDITPCVPATSILAEKVSKVTCQNHYQNLSLEFWSIQSRLSHLCADLNACAGNVEYLAWVKTQPCECCHQPSDDPHHLIGWGQGGMGTKAHDIFAIPLCRKHHTELHNDRLAFERKYGSQLEMIIKVLDRAYALGVLA
jgi:hypothetical protein